MFGIRNGVWFCVLLMIYGAIKIDAQSLFLGFLIFSLGFGGMMLSYLEGRFWIKNFDLYGKRVTTDEWED